MSYASLKTLRPFFTNKCGRLLAGGKVYTYEVGTLIPKATYKDAAGLTENTNPIVLDASGEADIYINSDYRFQIFDKDGVLIDDVDSVAPTQRISSAFLIDSSGFTQEQINASKEDTLNKGVVNGYASLNSEVKIPDEQISVVNNLTTSDAAKPLSSAMGKKLQDEKFAIANLVNDLTTGGIDKALTAEQGKQLLNMFTGGTGHFRIPNPLELTKPWIIQAGTLYVAGGVNGTTINLPIAFPNAGISFSAFWVQNAQVTSNVPTYMGNFTANRAQFNIFTNQAAGNNGTFWIAIGN